MGLRSRIGVGMLSLLVLSETACRRHPADGPDPESPIWVSRADARDTAVIFVHGIMGDLRGTFTSRSGVFWPDLLKTDPLFKDADIYTYGFSSTLWEKGLDIKQLAGEMHAALTAHRILNGHRRIVFVCHSMGGLVTRAFLTTYRDELRDKLAFLYFFATPSSGSAIASVGRHLFPNSHLEQMATTAGEAFLRDLQAEWLAAGFGRTIPSYCAYENKKFQNVVYIVAWASAAGLCNQGLIAIEADHLGVVKPAGVEDKPHLALRAAYIESVEARPDARATLIPANRIELRFDRSTQNFSVAFRGVVKAPLGGGDAIQEVYATLTAPDGRGRIPFGDTDYDCTRNSVPVATPFLFAASELVCTFSQRLGDLTKQVLGTPGDFRFAVTLETDDKRGHTVEYCFNLGGSDLSDILERSGLRRFHYAVCKDSGGS
jgi:pimeloyl-ACP methyl ester carboxylesterase